MESKSVLEFDEFKDYLSHLRSNFPGRRRAISLDKFAEILGYRSPRTVAMAMKGQRVPSRDLVFKLSQTLGLSSLERHYLELLVYKSKSAQNDPGLADRLEQLKKKRFREKQVASDVFSLIADWFHLPVRQLLLNRPVTSTAEWIAEKMRGKITVAQAKSALKKLEQLGTIERDPRTDTWRKPEFDSLVTAYDVPSAASQSHHAQMLDRAKEAITEQLVTAREFDSLSLKFDPRDIDAAKAMIREFSTEFNRRFYRDEAPEVYQLGVQFFAHTRHIAGQEKDS